MNDYETQSIREIGMRVMASEPPKANDRLKDLGKWLAVLGTPLCLIAYLALATKPSDVYRELQQMKQQTQPKDVLVELRELRTEMRVRTDDRFRANDFREYLSTLREQNPDLNIPAFNE